MIAFAPVMRRWFQVLYPQFISDGLVLRDRVTGPFTVFTFPSPLLNIPEGSTLCTWDHPNAEADRHVFVPLNPLGNACPNCGVDLYGSRRKDA